MAVAVVIFLVSAASLGLELILVRALSIGHWHSFSYFVISTALLGFAAGGTLVVLSSRFLSKFNKTAMWLFCFVFALSVPIVFYLSQKLRLDELQLIWDKHQLVYLFGYYLLFFIPFFCAGSVVALSFTVYGQKVHRLYFWNMAGSAVGTCLAVGLMYIFAPQDLLLVMSILGFTACIVAAIEISWKRIILTVVSALLCLWVFSPLSGAKLNLDINMAENKSLVYYQALPDVEIVDVRYSPLARLDSIKAPTIRYFPGLSFNFQGDLPEQLLIISDADGITAVNRFEGLKELGCYDFMSSALAYHLVENPKACVIGAGGGSDICQALAAGANNVTAVEMNPHIIDLMKSEFDEFSSSLYKRDDVKVVQAEGRSFLETTKEHFDIINISLLDSFSASSAGLYALNESHLYTVEAVEAALKKLNHDGMLTITRVLKTPARDGLKMFATLVETLRRTGISQPEEHLIMIRSWSTSTIVASRKAFSREQVKSVRNFAEGRSFDLVYVPGIEQDEINRFHQLETPVYYEACQRILSEGREDFYRDYPYNIRPATDDRPYFFDFFKWKTLSVMIRSMGRQWLLFSEWGYLVLAATLLQAILASVVLILLPLFVAKNIKSVKHGKAVTVCYFLLLGLAYMFLEMGFIQKMTLLIGHPVFGVAVTLSGFLFFSGCGSLLSERFIRNDYRRILTAVVMIVLLGILLIGFLQIGFDWLLGFSRTTRIILAILITAPLAFFMGMPFPSGLKCTHMSREPLVPWAWGVNGFASVTAAVLGTFVAISAGFIFVGFMALLFYALSLIAAKRICIQQVR
ncbi:MAG: spermine/spermidine synthase domain-containing protein [Planctomycetota bacterium]|jgi:spermidine synthase